MSHLAPRKAIRNHRTMLRDRTSLAHESGQIEIALVLDRNFSGMWLSRHNGMEPKRPRRKQNPQVGCAASRTKQNSRAAAMTHKCWPPKVAEFQPCRRC
jgi:hypothetical protein